MNQKAKVIHNIPYYSQWVSSELVGDIVSGRISANEDPKWKDSGAESVEEYEFWACNVCGMACLKMILEFWGMESPPLVTLGKECSGYGGYKVKEETIEGLYYQPFTEYLWDRFSLNSRCASPLTLEEIAEESLKGNIVIVSVHYSVRKPVADYSGKRGGHLVVVSGVDIKNNCLYINNPSGDNRETQKGFKLKFEQFQRYFAGRGVVISNPGMDND